MHGAKLAPPPPPTPTTTTAEQVVEIEARRARESKAEMQRWDQRFVLRTTSIADLRRLAQ